MRAMTFRQSQEELDCVITRSATATTDVALTLGTNNICSFISVLKTSTCIAAYTSVADLCIWTVCDIGFTNAALSVLSHNC
jgi:hypothetical protein